MATNFHDIQDEMLVELVAANPPVYDTSLKSYRDIVVRDKIWDEIGRQLNKSSECCRKRWRSIRDSYSRIKRKSHLKTKRKFRKWPLYDRLTFLDNFPCERKSISSIENVEDDTSNTHYSENEPEREMCEVDNKGETEIVHELVVEESTDEECQDDINTQRPKRLKRARSRDNLEDSLLAYWRERDERKEYLASQAAYTSQQDDVDGINSFCTHMGTMLKKLNPILRMEAKSKLFQMMTEFERKNLESSRELPKCVILATVKP